MKASPVACPGDPLYPFTPLCSFISSSAFFGLCLFFFLAFYSSFCLTFFHQGMIVWIHEMMRSNPKVTTLQQLVSPSGLVDKTSLERRVLSSLMNELAKQFTLRFFPSMQVSRRKAFDVVWSTFDNFLPFAQHPCVYKDKMLPLNSMCYDMFTTAISCTYSRLKKIQR